MKNVAEWESMLWGYEDRADAAIAHNQGIIKEVRQELCDELHRERERANIAQELYEAALIDSQHALTAQLRAEATAHNLRDRVRRYEEALIKLRPYAVSVKTVNIIDEALKGE